ncbi:fasciclin domain-containing protein [Chitinophaga sedimenti]|uniref:fasciclin domain-containing protein n=1 Tax=Chitinophaga sedimenti TaxID=2033606 RepID=UPI0020050C01|nr:fasciclin domain-containing protein [Chitinophaga sedimenti]MCK7556793.1 fasciclin domain-containing protein [Chitinophaga sedimenti]
MINFKLAMSKTVLACAAAVSVFFTSCSKDDDNNTKDSTITAIVTTNNDFSLLETALVHAGLTTVLSGQGPFTVFAPNNAAFVAAGFDTEAKIKAVPAETLKKILLYHVLNQKVTASAIAMASNTPVKTVNEANIFVTKNASGVYVNGAMVTQADLMASNGVIHVINTVLMPPSGNIVEVAQGNPNFSLLVAAVLRASQGSTNVAQVLSGAGPLTVFAPTNQAFINAGFANAAAIQAADPAVLTSILTYHVVSGRVFSSDLTEGAKPATLNGGTVAITLTGGAKVKGNKNTTASNVTAANMVTTNGVIHVIDQVLLP